MIFRRSFTILGTAALLACPVYTLAQAPPAATAAAPVTKPIIADAEKEKDIRQLIFLTGGDKVAGQSLERVIAALQDRFPEAPPAFWLEFRKKTKASEFVDLTLVAYDKYYSKEDIKGLIQFFQSPLGQKMLSVAPDIAQEGYVLGTVWGQQKAKEVTRELKAKKNAAPPVKPAPTKAKFTKVPAAKPPKP